MNESMIPPDADIGETFFSQRRFGATFSVKEVRTRREGEKFEEEGEES